MNRRSLLAFVLAMMVTAAPATAQDRGGDTANFEQKVLRLAHVDARETARTVQGFFTEGRAAFDERTNAIVLSAPPGEIEMAVRLIGELDVPAPEQTAQSSAIIQVGRDAPDELMELVRTLMSGNTRASFDRRSGMLVLNGDTRDIQEVRTLMEAISQNGAPAAQSPLTVSFFFIQGLMGPENSPKLPPPQGPKPDEPSPRDQAVYSKLEKPVEVNAERAPFEDVLKRLTEAADLDAVVNWSELESVGIDREQLVSLSLHSAIPVRQALELLFEQLGSESGLEYEVRDGILHIATKDYLDRNAYIEVYDVHELVKAVPRFALELMYAADASPAPPAAPGPGMGGFGGGGEGQQNPFTGGEDDTRPTLPYVPAVMWDERDDEPAEQLMDIIISTITPDDWMQNGGGIASIQQAGGMLVIKHNARGHQAIAELLDLLRKRHAATRAAVSRIEPPAMLAPVMGALAENGFRQAVLLAPLKVTVGRNGSFSLEGCAAQLDRMLGVKVEGNARMTDASNVELRVEAEIGPKVALPGTLGGPEPMFRLNSVVAAPLGDYVVLATSPGATDYGQAIALVVRVDNAK